MYDTHYPTGAYLKKDYYSQFFFQIFQIWKKLLPFSILLIFLSPFIFTWQIFFAGGYIAQRNASSIEEGFRLDYQEYFWRMLEKNRVH